MMTRKPDEIKKGLECCSNVNFVCNEECPYYKSLSEGEDCCLKKNADALVYIQQLESDKQQLEGLLTHMNQLRDAAAGRALKMEERVHQLEAERDAAVEDLQMGVCCGTCAYDDTDVNEQPCETCARTTTFGNWEWRGVTKEESQ